MLIFEIIEQVTTQKENGEQEVKDEVRFGTQQYTAMLLINHLGDILDLSCKAQTYTKTISGAHIADIISRLKDINETVDIEDQRVKMLAYFPPILISPENREKLECSNVIMFSDEYYSIISELQIQLEQIKQDKSDTDFYNTHYIYTVEW